MKAFKLFGVWVLAALGAVACARFFRTKILKKRFIGILAYHHITKTGLGPVSPVATLPGVFSRHVKMFSRVFRVLLMKDVCALLKSGAEFDKDGLVFTFDDGYMDSFDEAAPVLEALGVRGTFYVTTVSFTEQSFLWNDLVGEALSSLRPVNIQNLDIGPPKFRDMLKKIAILRDNKKGPIIRQAFDLLLDEDQFSRQNICEQLRQLLKINKTAYNRSRTLMDPELIVDLALRGHEIGAHTATHARLSNSGEFTKNEIIESVLTLRKNGLPISSFAYPFGHESDINSSCIETLKLSGISNAVTMEKNIIDPSSNSYLLPRIPVSPHHSASWLVVQFEIMAWKRLIKSWFHTIKPMKIRRHSIYNAA